MSRRTETLAFTQAGRGWRATVRADGRYVPGRHVRDIPPPPAWTVECLDTGEELRGPLWRDESPEVTLARLQLVVNREMQEPPTGWAKRGPWPSAGAPNPEACQGSAEVWLTAE